MEYTEKEIEKIIKDCDWQLENFMRFSSKNSTDIMKVVKQLVKSKLFGVGRSLPTDTKINSELEKHFVKLYSDDETILVELELEAYKLGFKKAK